MFEDTIDANADVIENALREEDIRLYTVKVHSLKSSARIIGAMELSSLAEKLEDAGNRQDRAFIDENTGRLLSDLRAYHEKLSRLHEDTGEDDREPVPEDELAGAYEALRELIPQMDYDSVEMILGQLGEYRLPPEDASAVHGTASGPSGRLMEASDASEASRRARGTSPPCEGLCNNPLCQLCTYMPSFRIAQYSRVNS